MMLRPAVAAALLAGLASGGNAAPQRIVSLNLCADELVLRLAPPGVVKSVTWLARDPALSNVSVQARYVSVNRGLAEDVVPLAPDLVIGGAQTTRTAVALLQRLGIPVLELSVPSSVEEAFAQIAMVAAAVGAPAQGAQLIADMKQAFAASPSVSTFISARPIAAVYQPNGFTIGSGSLINDLLKRAGLRNLAVEQRIDNYGALSLELLLFAQPDLLIMNAVENRGPAMAYEILRHPALMSRYGAARVVSLPSAWWSCAGPRLVDVVQRLRHAAQQLPPNAAR
ncbi:MAG: ABC transporter substrate-binding protein [Pseudomonadota bacterium]|nr:ABC transporter substrate-binding protein [Pseudomonadota bacterium]